MVVNGDGDVRRALSKPIDISRYNRPFLERTLANAKARMARDARYGQVLGAAPIASRIPCVNPVTGANIPWWLCIIGAILVIGLIIAFIL